MIDLQAATSATASGFNAVYKNRVVMQSAATGAVLAIAQEIHRLIIGAALARESIAAKSE